MALRWRDRHELFGCYQHHEIHIPKVHTAAVDLAGDYDTVLRQVRRDNILHAIIHCAGLANVDACQQHPEAAYRDNVMATWNVARAACSRGTPLIYISTDHLSDGSAAWTSETDPVSPRNLYAWTKWTGERIVQLFCPDALIVRTNFFGWGTPVKQMFSDWIVTTLRHGQPLPLCTDCYFTPIHVLQLIDLLESMIRLRLSGIWNVAGRERLSKYEFGIKLAQAAGLSTKTIRAITMAQCDWHAPRPADMSLSTAKLTAALGVTMPTLEQSLEAWLKLGARDWSATLARPFLSPWRANRGRYLVERHPRDTVEKSASLGGDDTPPPV